MTSSINHPWGISEKFKEKYGKIWAEMDFEIGKISNYHFRNNPLDTKVGTLLLCGQSIDVKFKQLISAANHMSENAKAVYFQRADKDDKFEITIFNKPFILKKHEIGKLSQTLNDSLHTIQVGYQIGTYL
jgi:hypothetical protein